MYRGSDQVNTNTNNINQQYPNMQGSHQLQQFIQQQLLAQQQQQSLSQFPFALHSHPVQPYPAYYNNNANSFEQSLQLQQQSLKIKELEDTIKQLVSERMIAQQQQQQLYHYQLQQQLPQQLIQQPPTLYSNSAAFSLNQPNFQNQPVLAPKNGSLSQQPVFYTNNNPLKNEASVPPSNIQQNPLGISECGLSMQSTNLADDFQNSQQISLQSLQLQTAPLPMTNNDFSYRDILGENLLSKKFSNSIEMDLNLKGTSQNLIPLSGNDLKYSSSAREEMRHDMKEQCSLDITSLQKNSKSSNSDEDKDGENNNSSPTTSADINKRTRCLYEPLFRIISPNSPDKKSYKKNIIKYLVSYHQGSEKDNEKSNKFVFLIEQNKQLELAAYITYLLKQCKMAQQKKDDTFAHGYIAERICKSFLRKKQKGKSQNAKQSSN